jgi:hypothetical protein
MIEDLIELAFAQDIVRAVAPDADGGEEYLLARAGAASPADHRSPCGSGPTAGSRERRAPRGCSAWARSWRCAVSRAAVRGRSPPGPRALGHLIGHEAAARDRPCRSPAAEPLECRHRRQDGQYRRLHAAVTALTMTTRFIDP